MKCVNTTGTAHCLIIVHYTNTVTYLQCQFHGLAISNAKLQIFFQIKYMEKIYQTALGNCFGLKLAKCWLQFQKKNLVVLFIIIFGTLSFPRPSVLWHCWLGGRKGIRPVKNWAVGYWCGYLPGARCRLAYGPADATATHCLLLQ